MSSVIKNSNVSFWNSLSLEELAELQGIQPIKSLDQISAQWPIEDEPDDLLNYILTERAVRRGRIEEDHS